MFRARAILLAVLASLVLAAPVAAGKPDMQRIPVNDLGIVDEFLSAECGFAVHLDFTGHFIIRAFTDENGDVVRELNNYAFKARIYSDWGSFRVVDVGVDRVTYHADGSITQSIIGNVQSVQLPGQGRVYSDVGQVTFMVTFSEDPTEEPTVELLSLAGQHDDSFPALLICEALAE